MAKHPCLTDEKNHKGPLRACTEGLKTYIDTEMLEHDFKMRPEFYPRAMDSGGTSIRALPSQAPLPRGEDSTPGAGGRDDHCHSPRGQAGAGSEVCRPFSQGSFRTSGRVGHSAESQQPESRGRSEKGWNHETRPHIVSHSLMDPTFQEHWRLIFSKQF